MNEQKAAWAVDLDRNWTFKDARILPDGERFILNVAGMLVTDFESVEEAKKNTLELLEKTLGEKQKAKEQKG